jgi:hypothetical protein
MAISSCGFGLEHTKNTTISSSNCDSRLATPAGFTSAADLSRKPLVLAAAQRLDGVERTFLVGWVLLNYSGFFVSPLRFCM